MTARDVLPANALRRGCDVCRSPFRRLLYKQRLLSFDGDLGLCGYDVVACDVCGFVYADRIPDSSVFERYYRDMSKYDAEPLDDHVPLTAQHNYETIASALVKALPERDARILDVGTANGGLLSVLRTCGYTDLTGLDPSPRSAAAVRRRGLRVLNSTISEMASSPERFDVILLAGVLEHLRDLGSVLEILKALLAEGGRIWLAVPDAGRFAQYVESPYQHLSSEHVNFFTTESLNSLFGCIGMSLDICWSSVHLLGAMQEPTLNCVYSVGQITLTALPDITGSPAIEDYIARSEWTQERLKVRVENFLDSRTSIVIWGIGSLTMHLLSDAYYAELRIVAFIDGNAHYWGKTIRGIPVISPSRLSDYSEPVLVISYSYEDEICAQIRDRHGARNQVVRLFG